MDSTVHDAITTCEGSQIKALQGIDALRESGVNVRINCPVTKINFQSIEGVKEFANSIGAPCGFDPIITPKTDCSLDPTNLRLGQKEWEFLLENGTISNTIYPNTYNFNDFDMKQKDRIETSNEPFCGAGTTSLAISSYGDVVPCVIFPSVMGNIRERSLNQIWSDEMPWKIIREFRGTDFHDCAGCELNHVCLKCPAVSLAESGNIKKPIKYFCETSKYYNQSLSIATKIKGGDKNTAK